MKDLSVDSTKLLTKKLSLARELATVKPELDHLRKQAPYQQTILADKLALQRQVATLEVELETEKRALKRASNKEMDVERDEELHKELEGLRRQLAKEKREKEKTHNAMEKGSSEWETRNTMLETKVDQLKTKLRDTKDQLKQSRAELAQALVAATKAPAQTPIKNGRKRNAQQITTDAAIGTPDGVAVRGRRPGVSRGKPEPTLLGEKSMFSITPYLNRTINAAPETLQGGTKESEMENKDSQLEDQDVMRISISPVASDSSVGLSSATKDVPLSKSKDKQKVTDKNVLKDAKANDVNTNAGSKKLHQRSTLEKVTEEEVDENVNPVALEMVRTDIQKPALKIQNSTFEETELRKKKRKLLGAAKTLFDDEDGEATRRPAKLTLGPARSLGKSIVGGKPVVGAFGAFSPLKKDKRGVQASFLS